MSSDVKPDSDHDRSSGAPAAAHPEESPGQADLAPEDLRAVAGEIEREFPLVAERPTLVLFDVDPDHLQAQWQVDDAALTAAWSAFPPASGVQPMLRLRQTGEADPREVAVLPRFKASAGLQGEALFSVRGPGADFEAELGLASPDGGWLLLVRSNRVRLPEQSRQRRATEAISHAAETPGAARGGSPVPAAAAGAAAASPGPAAGPIGVPGERDSVAAPDVAGVLQAEPAHAQTAAGAAVEPALAVDALPLPPEFPLVLPSGTAAVATQAAVPLAAAARDLAQAMPGAGEPPAPRPRSEQTGIPVPPGAPPAVAPGPAPAEDPGAWAQLPPPILPSSGEAQAVPDAQRLSDPRAALSSGVFLDPGAAANLEIHAELRIWGRAAPGSLIDVFGWRLRVGADGRFSVRRPLQDPGLLVQAFAGQGDDPGPAGG